MILQTTDFEVGKLRIAQDQNTVRDLNTYLTTDNDKQALYGMMGKVLADIFIADLTADTPQSPQLPQFTFIFEPFTFEYSSFPYSCVGIKEILKYLYYCDFVGAQPIVNTTSGNQSTLSEASVPEDLIERRTIYYNECVREINKLQDYLSLNVGNNYSDFVRYTWPLESPI